MNSASSRRAAVSGQPPAVWGGRARRPGGVRAPIAPRWHPAGMSQMAARYDLRARSYGRCWAPVLAPAAIDAAVSSFVLHLVPDRAAALGGLRSLLRPGGTLAFVVWAGEAKPWGAAEAFDRALARTLARAGAAAPAPTGGPRAGPIGSAAAARAELRAAGFADVDAWEPTLHYPFGRAETRALFVEYDRAAELDALSPTVRAAVLAAFDAALARLPDDAFPWDAPLVAARAVRPPDD